MNNQTEKAFHYSIGRAYEPCLKACGVDFRSFSSWELFWYGKQVQTDAEVQGVYQARLAAWYETNKPNDTSATELVTPSFNMILLVVLELPAASKQRLRDKIIAARERGA